MTDPTTPTTTPTPPADPGDSTSIGPEWRPCVKLPITVHVRDQHHHETHVSTREGITPVRPDDLIMRGVRGEEYPIGRELFNMTYRLGTADPTPTPREGLTDKQLMKLASSHWTAIAPYSDHWMTVEIRSSELIAYARAAIAAARPAPAPAPTPEELQAQFRAWFQQEHGLPPSATATAHAADFALHLLSRGVQ